MDLEILSDLFSEYRDVRPSVVEKLPGAGSARRYYRLSDASGWSCIGVGGDSERDCRAFVALARDFGQCGIKVPEIYSVSKEGMHYLQQDLGSLSLFDYIQKRGSGSAEVRKAVEDTIRSLARLHAVPSDVWENDVEYGVFSRRQVMWDLNYFKYEYLKPSGFDFDEDALEDDFECFADALTARPDGYTFMYRDCQSRNVMLVPEDNSTDNEPFWIDFQGGRKGPGLYDVVSFLWQARAGFNKAFRGEMTDVYFEALRRTAEDNASLQEGYTKKDVGMFALFRTLQVLGAYGLRGLVERKAHFIESIPGALNNLAELVDEGYADNYPELKRIAGVIVADGRFKKGESAGLTIKVFSFSYKKGYPVDYSGNGGGFMFDCRGMHNPGRYEEYKKLTGRDKPVIDFLEGRGEVQRFVDDAMSIVAGSVETYLRRGFSSLQVGFGCTGGQHRSVYCAERMARLLKERYPEVNVKLIHREHP